MKSGSLHFWLPLGGGKSKAIGQMLYMRFIAADYKSLASIGVFQIDLSDCCGVNGMMLQGSLVAEHQKGAGLCEWECHQGVGVTESDSPKA
jgi:hypothetical protein